MEETDLEQYILNYYTNLLTIEEQTAYKYLFISEKTENSSKEFREMLMNKWGTTNQDTLKLLEARYDEFRKKVATRILSEQPDSVFINNCSNCGKLARTPYAKQCRFCGHDWH